MSRLVHKGPDDYAGVIRFEEKIDAYGDEDQGFQHALKFENRYQPDGTDNWLQEVDALDIGDLDGLDPSMLAEADRRALRLKMDNDLRGFAQHDLYMYVSLRYGVGCPEPEKVVYPHQEVVINDLMNLETTVQKILTTDLTDEEFAELEDDPISYWLTAPRGFVKTSTVSEWLEWKIGRDVTIKSKLVAANEKGSIQQLAMIKKNIQLDPLFRAVFPHVQIDPKRANNKTNLSLKVPPQMVDTRNATIEAWGIGSSPERGRTNLLWFDDTCWISGSEVWAENGIVAIEDIEIGDAVYNRLGELEEVTRIYCHSSLGEIVQLTTRHLTNVPVCCTPNHRIWARTAYRQDNGVVRRGRGPEGPAEYIEAGDLQIGDWLWLPDIAPYDTDLTDVDEELAWLLGFYVAEGGFRTGSDRAFHFTVHRDEIEFQERVTRIFEDRWGASVSWSNRTDRNCSEAFVTCPEFAVYAFLCGDGAANKCIPGAFFHASRELRSAFLRGLWDGDGCYRQSRYDLVTVSSQLAAEVQMLLLSVGIVAKRYCAARSHMEGANYDLWSVYFGATVQDGDLPGFELSVGSRRAAGIIRDDNGWWVQITSTARVAYDGPVYNLEVGADHSYVVSGIGVANCTYENSVVEEKERENIKEKLRVAWFPLRSGPEMIRIWTCTPFSDEDASMMLFRKRGWRKRFIKVSHDFSHLIDMARENTTYELPARRWDPVRKRFMPWWSERELRKLYKEDPHEFEVAYRLNTVDTKRSGANFDALWFLGDETTDRHGCIQYGFAANHDLYKPSLTITGVDIAAGESRKAKNTAVGTIGLMEDGTRVLLEMSYAHGDDLGCVTETARHCARWNPDLIVVEDNAAQKVVVSLLIELDIFDQKIQPFTTDRFKNAKLKLLANEVEDGKWVFPLEHAEAHWPYQACQCGTCYLIAEMIGYPEFVTSDCLMALMFAREGLKTLGVGRNARIDEFSLGKIFR